MLESKHMTRNQAWASRASWASWTESVMGEDIEGIATEVPDIEDVIDEDAMADTDQERERDIERSIHEEHFDRRLSRSIARR